MYLINALLDLQIKTLSISMLNHKYLLLIDRNNDEIFTEKVNMFRPFLYPCMTSLWQTKDFNNRKFKELKVKPQSCK